MLKCLMSTKLHHGPWMKPRRQCDGPWQPESFKLTQSEPGMEVLILNRALSPDRTFPPTWQPGSEMGQ